MTDGSIKGLDRLLGKLRVLQIELDTNSKKGLYLSGLAIEDKAKQSIMGGGKTGRVYRKGKGGKIQHRASAPGEAPANDTGRLVNSIHTDPVKDGNVVQVKAGSGAVDYAIPLEFGTNKMEPRPFMRPALKAAMPEIEAHMKRAVKDATATVKKK